MQMTFPRRPFCIPWCNGSKDTVFMEDELDHLLTGLCERHCRVEGYPTAFLWLKLNDSPDTVESQYLELGYLEFCEVRRFYLIKKTF